MVALLKKVLFLGVDGSIYSTADCKKMVFSKDDWYNRTKQYRFQLRDGNLLKQKKDAQVERALSFLPVKELRKDSPSTWKFSRNGTDPRPVIYRGHNCNFYYDIDCLVIAYTFDHWLDLSDEYVNKFDIQDGSWAKH